MTQEIEPARSQSYKRHLNVGILSFLCCWVLSSISTLLLHPYSTLIPSHPVRTERRLEEKGGVVLILSTEKTVFCWLWTLSSLGSSLCSQDISNVFFLSNINNIQQKHQGPAAGGPAAISDPLRPLSCISPPESPELSYLQLAKIMHLLLHKAHHDHLL